MIDLDTARGTLDDRQPEEVHFVVLVSPRVSCRMARWVSESLGDREYSGDQE